SGRLHQWRDGGAGRRLASAQFRRGRPAAMDRVAVGESARRAREELKRAFGAMASQRARLALANCLPKQAFPGYPSRLMMAGAGHHQVTMMGEPDRIMARQIL